MCILYKGSLFPLLNNSTKQSVPYDSIYIYTAGTFEVAFWLGTCVQVARDIFTCIMKDICIVSHWASWCRIADTQCSIASLIKVHQCK